MVLPFNLAASNAKFCVFDLNNIEKQLSVLNMLFSVLQNSLFVLCRELSNYITYLICDLNLLIHNVFLTSSFKSSRLHP